MKHIGNVIQEKKCVACGLCSSSCPVSAISMNYDKKSGFILPDVDESLCIDCGKCSKNCAAKKNMLKSNLEVREVFLAHSTSEEVQFWATSGGVINTLVSYTIKNKYFDAVILVAHDYESPIEAKAIVVTLENVEDLSNNPREFTSRYVVVPVLEIISQVKKQYDKVAIVGTPCQIRAVSNLGVFTIGITCSGGISYKATEEYKRKMKAIEYSMYYRGKGWPGSNSLVNIDKSIDYHHTGSLFERMFSSQIFKNPACRYCTDHFADFADISFCDYWNSEEMKNEKMGNSCVIVRSIRGKEIISKLSLDNQIVIVQKLTMEEIEKTQKKILKVKKGKIRDSITYKIFMVICDFVFKTGAYRYFNIKIYDKFSWIYAIICDK